MWRDVANIWRKEMVTTVRDRKGMTQAILVPLIIAVFYASFTPLLNKAMFERSQKPLVIPAVGVEYADPKLLDTMHEFGITLEGYKGDLEHAVERGDEESGLVFEPGFSEDLAEERPAQARLITNSTAGGVFGGAFSDSRLQLAVSVFNQKVAAARVAARGVDPSALMPVILETEDVATPEPEGALWASFYLPILVAVVVAQGGLFVAIDVTAGEKERGTLDALLVTPASDWAILLGKMGAVFVTGIIPLFLSLTAFWVVSNVMPSVAAVEQGALPVFVLWGSLLIGIPMALVMSVAQMIASVRARTFRDAQSAASPLVFAMMIPGFIAAFAPPKALWPCLIPLYGPFAALSRMTQAGHLQWDSIGLATLGSLGAAVVLMAVATRLFDRERLLYAS